MKYPLNLGSPLFDPIFQIDSAYPDRLNKQGDQLAQVLGEDVSAYEAVLPRLRPLQITPRETLMEWGQVYEEAEIGHRHISHLFALHSFHYPAGSHEDHDGDGTRR